MSDAGAELERLVAEDEQLVPERDEQAEHDAIAESERAAGEEAEQAGELDVLAAWKEARRVDYAVYELLCRPMPTYEKDGQPHIATEQAIGRLNNVLGPSGWEFAILPAYGPHPNPWYDAERDVVVCLGEITVHWPSGRSTKHTEVGGAKPNRYKAERRPDPTNPKRGEIMDLSDTFKAAVSDCVKRCAYQACGVGLWLRKKAGAKPVPAEPSRQQHQAQQVREVARSGQSTPAVAAAPRQVEAADRATGAGVIAPKESSTADLLSDVEVLLTHAITIGDRRWKPPVKGATAAALRAQIDGMERVMGVKVSQVRTNLEREEARSRAS